MDHIARGERSYMAQGVTFQKFRSEFTNGITGNDQFICNMVYN